MKDKYIPTCSICKATNAYHHSGVCKYCRDKMKKGVKP